MVEDTKQVLKGSAEGNRGQKSELDTVKQEMEDTRKKRTGSDGKKAEEVRKNLETNTETEDWTRCEERQKRMRGSS